MILIDLLETALSALTLNKVRAFLATLGIIIGIGSVIAFLSLGEGGKLAIKQEVALLGSNLLTVTPGGVLQLPGSSASLKLADSQALSREPSMKAFLNRISPEFSTDTNVSGARKSVGTTVLGVTSDYQFVHAISMQNGVFITQRDETDLLKSVVIGPQLAATLFGNSDPIGRTVHINKTPFVVSGVTQSKGGNIAQSQDNLAFIPLRVAEYEVFGQHNLSAISLSVKDAVPMVEAQNSVGYFLMARHHIADPQRADFSILSQNDVLAVASKTSQTLTSLLAAIAGISLVVGGIGIMNIMLMSVVERTREIGLRKALGATDFEIVIQIITETVVLTVVGGVLGVVGGVISTIVISSVLHTLFVISFFSVGVSLSVASLMGLIFGLYPAYRAAQLSPMEALRYE